MRTIKKLTTLLAVLLLFGVADMNAQGWLGGLKSQAGSSQKDNRLGTFDFSEFLTHCDYAVEDAGPAIAVLPVSYMESEAFINLQERLYHAIGNSPEFYDEAIKMHEGIIEMNKDNLSNLLDNESTIIYGVRNGKNYILSKDGREIGELRMGDNTHEVIYY